MNQITRETAKELGINFNSLIEDFIEDSYKEHRRGSNFYMQSIVELDEECYPEIPKELYGFWETNDYIWDDNHGYDKSEIHTLTRVQKLEKIVTTYEWIPIND